MAAMVACLAIWLASLPRAASAQPGWSVPADELKRHRGPLWRLRQVSVGMYLGLSASNEVDGATRDLDLLFGGDFRFDAPVHRFIMLGARFLFRGGNFAASPPRQEERLEVSWFDLGAVIRIRVPIAVRQGKTLVSPYVAVMPGFTLGTSPPGVLDDLAVGWAVGTVVGLRTIFVRRVGIFVEGGWETARVNFNDADTILRSGTIEFGPLFAF